QPDHVVGELEFVSFFSSKVVHLGQTSVERPSCVLGHEQDAWRCPSKCSVVNCEIGQQDPAMHRVDRCSNDPFTACHKEYSEYSKLFQSSCHFYEGPGIA